MMRRILVLFLVACSLFAGLSVSAASEGAWWNEDYCYMMPIYPSSASEPSAATIDLSGVWGQLGFVEMDSRYGVPGGIDPLSFHVVSVETGDEVPFSWQPETSLLLADFDSGLPDWAYGGEIWAVPSDAFGDSQSMAFSKNTTSSIKIYSAVPAEDIGDMSYLSFMGKGTFRVALRDPAKGVFLLDEVVSSSSYVRHVLPLDFTEFREGISYYLEWYPTDDYTINWIDDVTLMGDVIEVYSAPASGDLALYFNTYSSGTNGSQDASYVPGASVVADVGPAEGFRITGGPVADSVLSGMQDITIDVHDARNELEWVRYRIDWPSLLEFDQWEYGVWGDLTPNGDGTWTAEWDTVHTVCDGHHDIAVMARDSLGNEVFTLIPVEVENIAPGTVIDGEKTSFSFAMIGDTQPVAGGGIPNPYVASYIMDAASREDIDFIIQVGDVVYAGHEVEYLQLRDQITSMATVPFYAAPGNHDTAASEGLDLFRYYFGDAYYSFQYGNTYLIFLCTELPGEKGYITGDQLAWLDTELAAHADMDHIIITAHQPLYPVYHGIVNQDEVHAVIEKYSNVSAIFQGHEHTYNHENVKGMDIFVTGGATWLDGQYELENTFNHYFVFTVDGGSLSWDVISTDHLDIEDPVAGYVTTEPTITVEGTTQPYSTVTVNGVTVESTERGDYAATIDIPMGETLISVSADFPLGGGASTSSTVTRIGTLTLSGPETATVGEPLMLSVTDAEGTAVQGATVDLMGDQYVTSPAGQVEILEFTEGELRVSAYHDNYEGTFLFVEAQGPSGGMGTLALAGVAIVVILAVAVILSKRK